MLCMKGDCEQEIGAACGILNLETCDSDNIQGCEGCNLCKS